MLLLSTCFIYKCQKLGQSFPKLGIKCQKPRNPHISVRPGVSLLNNRLKRLINYQYCRRLSFLTANLHVLSPSQSYSWRALCLWPLQTKGSTFNVGWRSQQTILRTSWGATIRPTERSINATPLRLATRLSLCGPCWSWGTWRVQENTSVNIKRSGCTGFFEWHVSMKDKRYE